MAICSTKAIVISSLKYSDTSLIVKLYTQKKGLQSFLLRGVLSSKKRGIKSAYFLPLTQLDVVASIRDSRNLQSIKEVSVLHQYTSLSSNIIKQSIVLFLSEILSNAIKEQEENIALYKFLERSFLWLDAHGNVANFHLFFMLELTKYLGFYPHLSKSNYDGFDLLEGTFASPANGMHVITGKKLTSFKLLLGTNFDAIENVSFSKKDRRDIIIILTNYFKLHIDGFSHPKSLDVLETVFE